ncbi:MAG: hypothetical protein IJA85_06795 [Clostridia bacterium]|nr:hypothetical protein [Clostridia bacterium]
MKNAKKSKAWTLLLTLLSVMLFGILFLTSCTPDGSVNSGSEDDVSQDLGTATPKPGSSSDEMTINLAQYTVVYGADSSDEVTKAVTHLQNILKTYAGVEISAVDDSTARSECEIVVGKTAIEQAASLQSTLPEDNYCVVFEGSRIFLLGYGDEDVAYAVSRFLNMTTGYHADKYENLPIHDTTVTVTKEIGKTVGQILSGGREIISIEPCSSTPLDLSKEFKAINSARMTENEILFKDSGAIIWNGKTGDGSYRVQMTVESRTNVIPDIYFRVNAYVDGTEQVQFSVQAEGANRMIYLNRATTKCGGTDVFPANPANYTLRMDVHPEVGRLFYYIDGIFLGELYISEADLPLVENCGMNVDVVGSGMDVVLKDIYIESIDCVDEIKYDAVDIEIGNDAVYPKSENAPADTIYVVEIMKLPAHDRLTILTLQGLVNRTTPQLFVDFRAYNHGNFIGFTDGYENTAHLDILRNKGRKLVTITLEEALVQFADFYNGVVMGDCFSNNYNENVATSLCGVLDAVYMSEERYTDTKNTIKKDILFRLDNRFESSVDAYMWLWENYGDQFSKTVLFHTNAAMDNVIHAPLYCRDYAVMSRAFTFAATDVKTIEDYNFYMSIFASTAPNTPVIGFGQGGTSFLEGHFFSLCGRFGKYFTYGFACANMSLMNSLEFGELKQKDPVEIPKLEDDTMYISYVFSEGDNLSWDMHLWLRTLTEDPNGYGTMSDKGYSICGALYYVAPAFLEYLYQQASPNDYFFMDGGGISNLASPDDFAFFLKDEDREAAVTRMLELTEYVADKTDIDVLRAIANISDEMSARYDKECPSLSMLISAYGSRAEGDGGTEQYDRVAYMVDDIVRCRTHLLTFNRAPLKAHVRALLKQRSAKNAKGGTVFSTVFVLGNDVLYDLSQVLNMTEDIQSGTDKKVVVVRPDVFAQLYSQYAAQ